MSGAWYCPCCDMRSTAGLDNTRAILIRDSRVPFGNRPLGRSGPCICGFETVGSVCRPRWKTRRAPSLAVGSGLLVTQKLRCREQMQKGPSARALWGERARGSLATASFLSTAGGLAVQDDHTGAPVSAGTGGGARSASKQEPVVHLGRCRSGTKASASLRLHRDSRPDARISSISQARGQVERCARVNGGAAAVSRSTTSSTGPPSCWTQRSSSCCCLRMRQPESARSRHFRMSPRTTSRSPRAPLTRSRSWPEVAAVGLGHQALQILVLRRAGPHRPGGTAPILRATLLGLIAGSNYVSYGKVA